MRMLLSITNIQGTSQESFGVSLFKQLINLTKVIIISKPQMFYAFEYPIFSPANYNIFEIINFKTYEALPRWQKQDPDPLFMKNLNRTIPRIAWHSRYRTTYPHSLQYMTLRYITLDDIQQLMKVLKNPNLDINKPIDKKYNLTALQFAAMKNKFPIIEILLMHGANINVADEQGNTPLMMAVANHSLEAINTLLKNGCDRNIANVYGISPRQKAIQLQSQYIAQFIDKFPKTGRKFPKFRIKLDIESKINSPIIKFLSNYKIFSKKALKSPFNNFKGDYRIMLNNFKTFPDILKQKNETS